jgi:hypothetical protein
MSVTRRHKVEDGIAAWDRLKTTPWQNYNDWCSVGEALFIGKIECMAAAATNRPQGTRYRLIFGEWLKLHRFNMNSADRTRALAIIENRLEIEKWRASLALDDRLNLNHPKSLLRRFHADKSEPQQ